MHPTSSPALARRHPSWLGARMGWLACGLIAAIGLVATVRAAPPAASPPDPADSQVAVPAVVYRSALPPRGADALPVGPPTWRAANDTTARIGGWRAYLREAQTLELAPESTPAPPRSAATTPRDASPPSPASPTPQAPSAPPPAAHKH